MIYRPITVRLQRPNPFHCDWWHYIQENDSNQYCWTNQPGQIQYVSEVRMAELFVNQTEGEDHF